MGAGKSTVGLRLARELGWTFVDLDDEIVRSRGNSIAEIFDEMGEPAFRQLEHAALATALQQSELVLALGGGALETTANRQLFADSLDTSLVYLEAPLEELIARCERQYESKSGAVRRPVFEQRSELAQRFQRRKPLYEASHHTVGTSNRDPDQIVQSILRLWRAQTPSQQS